MIKRHLSACLLALTLFVTSIPVLAQNTGRISGVITEAGINEPLPAVNVRIVGSNLGAQPILMEITPSVESDRENTPSKSLFLVLKRFR